MKNPIILSLFFFHQIFPSQMKERKKKSNSKTQNLSNLYDIESYNLLLKKMKEKIHIFDN